MDYYSVILMTRLEHDRRIRKMQRIMDYGAPVTLSQPNWAMRQFKRLRRGFGNSLVAIGERMSRGQRMSTEGTIIHTKGQEVPS